MRHLLRLAYCGAAYHGWQRQPNARTVQQTLEETLGRVCNAPVELVGCGRTDAGVHASDYAAHFEWAGALPPDLLRRVNRLLPPDIAVYGIEPTKLHARFDAAHRAYRYDLTARKDPFRVGRVWHYHAAAEIDRERLDAAAAALLDYGEFAPFCKAHSDARTMRCDLRRSEWAAADDGRELHYHIAADRFLRGMVRLIVGACVQHARGRLSLDELHGAMREQRPLARPLSVPGDGLYLTEVRYHTGSSRGSTVRPSASSRAES